MKHQIYRFKFNSRKWFEHAGNFPVHIDIELAGKCQLACTMCPYGTGDFGSDKQGMMPDDVAKIAVHESARYGASSIKFNFRGEPGLYKRLNYFVALAKKQGIIETAINTNLTAFTKERLKALCDAGLDLIIISIDGATKETYEKIRIKGNWEKLNENLEFLHKQYPKPKIRIQMVQQPLNVHETELFKKLFGRYTTDLVIQNLRQSNEGKRRRCPQPWQRLIVAWDGQVFACCSNWDNEFPVGQFPEQSLYDIWNTSPLLIDLRRRAKDFNSFPCRDCKVGASYK